MNTDSHTLTVLICTHNRAELLLRTLHFLNAAQRPRGWQVQILVVLNACSDTSRKDLCQLQKQSPDGLPLEWIEEPVPGKSHALNHAIPRIASDLVAFVDDDHRVDTDYLANACAAAEKYPDMDLFCGRILPDWDGTEPHWVHDTGPYRIYPLPVPRFDQGETPLQLTPEIAIPGGGNLFLRGPWLARVGRFSTSLGPTGHDLEGSEDLDWIIRAQKLGARLQYVPSVVQYHYVDLDRLKLGYLLEKAYKRSGATVGIRNPTDGHIPRYLYRKLASYLFSALLSLRSDRRRFYLVRTAAALGEMKGHRQQAGLSGTVNEKRY